MRESPVAGNDELVLILSPSPHVVAIGPAAFMNFAFFQAKGKRASDRDWLGPDHALEHVEPS